MSFGRRLAMPFVGLIVLVQAVAGISFYSATRAAVTKEAEVQLASTIDEAVHLWQLHPGSAAGLPRGASLVVADGSQSWSVVAGDLGAAVTTHLPSSFAELPRQVRIIHTESDELLVQTALLRDVPGRPRGSVVDLGHALGFAVSVEGVEDEASLEVVTELGCDYAQGYHIARPLVVDVLALFVRDPPHSVSA